MPSPTIYQSLREAEKIVSGLDEKTRNAVRFLREFEKLHLLDLNVYENIGRWTRSPAMREVMEKAKRRSAGVEDNLKKLIGTF